MQQRRRALSVHEDADLVAVGHPLFTGLSLDEALRRSGQAAVNKAVGTALASGDRLSKLRLRRMAITAGTHAASITLGQPTNGGIEVRAKWTYATCIVPFSGDEQLFRLSVPGYPPPRPLYGTIWNASLIIRVRYGLESGDHVESLLASELRAIIEQLELQREVSAQYNRDLPDAVRAYVNRRYDELIGSRDSMH